ncbi:UvrD-helicase domain-containing protein [Mycolicibacterium brumae]|uniref:DNA 3'-5' helicase n=1 Tax=Mycolicibacterium brumae TaxID=85968 RepID=A0A2G5P6A6_9MYCO|nr:UvrD-helicase domain-containing protein [Mycolicibacterium brumae]MCV7194042.1 UvrD-helicase domain-containing protein [Mycolicibacterium brumae]PIB73796.1 DNA helicase UvrD [Mycolicibacterium brumae]RWA19956.1 hypothetical protein MBRU_16190 [Mycolicibacterium brumae DSM 44177]UWW09714.1 AAA family ATPase [Mycolicibacterium brumae]
MKVEVVLHELFHKSSSGLDAGVLKRMMQFLEKIQQDPEAPGLDFKQPKGAADKRVRTARVTDNYRAVLVNAGAREDISRLYLVAVKPHDEAYKFAETVSVGVNKKVGAAEIFDPIAVSTAIENARPEEAAAPIVPATVSQADLERFGVSPDVAVELKKIADEHALYHLVDALPVNQGFAILELVSGKDPQDVWSELLAQSPGAFDSDDFRAAADREVSRASFAPIDTDNPDELLAMLSGDLAAWRIWLHPLQHKLARHEGWNGPFRVTGGAGTGKTVTAVHRARFLANRLSAAGADAKVRVLFTTFTRNLANAIEVQLVQLAGPGVTDRVHTTNIDALARAVLAGTPGGRTLVNSMKVVSSVQTNELWRIAARGCIGEWDHRFLEDEWSYVVLGNAIIDESGYLRAPRAGRLVRLSRSERVDVWAAIERFQKLMQSRKLTTFTEIAANAAAALTADQSLARKFRYRHAVIDEAQDLHPVHWNLLRALVPRDTDDMFIVGDAHQRIYGKPAPLSRFGIETRGRSRRLTVNYRTSREILEWVLSISPADIDDLDAGADSLVGARSVFSGPAPELLGFESVSAENNGLIAKIRDWQVEGVSASDVGVFVYERNDVREVASALNAGGVAASIVDGDTDETRLGDVVRVMTMHRAKGLEYRAVALARLGSTSFPPAYLSRLAGLERDQEEQKVLRVLYVAGSRARERLAILWTGKPSPLLTGVKCGH